MNPKIGIVIVNYNGEKFLEKCIKSILTNNYRNYEIIIVDNNSKDKSKELIKAFNDNRIILIECDENYGVAKGNNIGIKKSISNMCEYTLLLNNDTICPSTILSSLIKKIGFDEICVPKILYPDYKTIWYCGGKLEFNRGSAKHFYYNKENCKEYRYKEYYNYAPTTCMLIRNSVFEKIGLMDEKYFLYFDDTDFCMRLYLYDIKIKLCYEDYIIHLVGKSTGGDKSTLSIYYMTRNKFYFVKKYKKYFKKVVILLIYLKKYRDYIKGKIMHTNNHIIKKAIADYKKGKMGRCDEI